MNGYELYKKVVRVAEKTMEKNALIQVMDENRPDFGGFFYDKTGIAIAGSTGDTISVFGLLYYAEESEFYKDENLRKRILAAVSFIKRSCRKDGLLDMPWNNYDSSPDTAFTLSPMAILAYVAKKNGDDEMYDSVMEFVIPSARAVAKNGFHTPNHRWVICGALSLVMELEPEKCDFTEIIDLYLAETIDMDSDGLYSERSLGIYDKVENLMMLIMAESCKSKLYSSEDFFDRVDMNLNTRLDFTNCDGTVETSFSGRQDNGTRSFLDCADTFTYMAIRNRNGEFASAAEKSVDELKPENLKSLFGYLYFFCRHPEWKEEVVENKPLRTKVERLLNELMVYRVREDKLCATAQCKAKDFMKLIYGDVYMPCIRLSSLYLGGMYTIKRIEKMDFGARLYFESDHMFKQLPGYWMPTGKPVSPTMFRDHQEDTVAVREVKKRPKFEVVMDLHKVEDGFDIHLKIDKGMDAVHFSLLFMFEPGGQVEMEDCSFTAFAGNELFLKKNEVTYVKNNDAITISGGFYAHKIMINTEDTKDKYFRVILTDFSPVDRVVKIRCGNHTGAQGPCDNGKIMNREYYFKD